MSAKGAENISKTSGAAEVVEATPAEAWDYSFCAAYDIIHLDTPTEEANYKIEAMAIEISSADQPFINKLFRMKRTEYSNEVVFKSDGDQGNAVREIVRLIGTGDKNSRQTAANQLAERLARATPGQAPRGLLVVLVGDLGTRQRVAVWKFPNHDTLSVIKQNNRFLFSVAKAFAGDETTDFKAACFEGTASKSSMWKGRVKDTQTPNSAIDVAKYWMDFLHCERLLSPVYATTLACKALRKVAERAETEEERVQIDAAVVVLKAQDGASKTMNQVAETLPVTKREEFVRALKLPTDQLSLPFTVNAAQVESAYRYRVLAFESGITVKGRRESFEDDQITVEKGVDGAEDRVTIKGRIIKDRAQAG